MYINTTYHFYYRWITLLLLFFVCNVSFAQDKRKFKFGDIKENDFLPKLYAIDSNANAVILADVGASEIVGNNKGWFSLRFKKFRRVHILNKNGYDIANVSIPYYRDAEDEERLEKLKATTYSLENGKIVETVLDVKLNVFTEKVDKNRGYKKFTMPNVKEGVIIEYEFTIESDFLRQLRPWEFQGVYPCLWSEYNLALPNFLGYIFLTQGYRQFDEIIKKERKENFNVIEARGTASSEYYNLPSNVADHKWIMKNVPALKEESYTTSIDNHISKIEFQLSEYRDPLTPRKLMNNWVAMSQALMKDENFGQPLTRDNGWLKEEIGAITSNAHSDLEKAQKIYRYIRDNFTISGNKGIGISQSLKNLIKLKSGTAAEINLLLTAMLRQAQLPADPVILSTRSNGYSYPLYPLLSQYNYVIVRTNIEGKEILLDASTSDLAFGYLPLHCYNGHARIINEKNPIAYELSADSLLEKKSTVAFVSSDEKGKLLGGITQTPGFYESLNLRRQIKEMGKDVWGQKLAKNVGDEFLVSNVTFDALMKDDEPLQVKYDFDFETGGEEVVYFNPMLFEARKDNPFKSAQRSYPVEMPFKIDETFSLQLEIPTGYQLDELPTSILLRLNEQHEGMFEYRVTVSGNAISFRSRIKLDRAFFMPDEYDTLRTFFNIIISKQAEQIVFKKKK
jgi:transglutaminase-like putative cysteine protease